MKKIIVFMAMSVLSIFAFSCGTQKNTPGGTNPVDTNQTTTDSTRPTNNK